MVEKGHSGERSIGRRIHMLDRWMRLYIADELGDLGIGAGQFPFLMALYHRDGRTQEELTQAVNVDKATTTRAIGKLVKEGYVRKERDSKDRRAYRVHLTDKANDIKPKLRRTLRKWTELLTQDLTKEEEETLRKLMDKMTANAPRKGGIE
jgi:DNA-binding MarR family transcriptional regulator